MKHVLFFLILALITSCDPYDDRLNLVNNSENDIFYSISKTDSFSKRSNPLRIVGNDTVLNESLFIKSKSEVKEMMLGRNSWEEFVKNECDNGKLRIFIFNDSLINKNNWDSIVKNQSFSKKYSHSFESLIKNQWRVLIK
jgi:hypothetical protein